jgi:hypothetical protein
VLRRCSQGMSVPDAGIAAGVSLRTDWAWLVAAGGVKPKFPAEGPRRCRRLNLQQREEIALGGRQGVGALDRRPLGRTVSTISWEITNNSVNHGYRSPYRFGARRRGPEQRSRYEASAAPAKASTTNAV